MPKIIGIIIGLIINAANINSPVINTIKIMFLKSFSFNMEIYDDKSL